MLGFSLTLPATRVAVMDIDPLLVGLGRALVAATLALIVLMLRRQPLPTHKRWWPLAVVALGVVVGFPMLTSLAMRALLLGEHVSPPMVLVALLVAVSVVMGQRARFIASKRQVM